MFRKIGLLAVFFFSVSTLGWSAERSYPIESLSELPSKWEGVAGDLVTRVPAELKIEKIKKEQRGDLSNPFPAVYEVDASLTFGARKILVQRIRLDSAPSQNVGEQQFEVMISLADDLTPTLFALIHFDETTKSYVLKELSSPPRDGRFKLTARAH